MNCLINICTLLYVIHNCRLWPQQSSDDLHEIFKLRRELPGQGGEKWSTLKAETKHFYFDELRVSLNVTICCGKCYNALFVERID